MKTTLLPGNHDHFVGVEDTFKMLDLFDALNQSVCDTYESASKDNQAKMDMAGIMVHADKMFGFSQGVSSMFATLERIASVHRDRLAQGTIPNVNGTHLEQEEFKTNMRGIWSSLAHAQREEVLKQITALKEYAAGFHSIIVACDQTYADISALMHSKIQRPGKSRTH